MTQSRVFTCKYCDRIFSDGRSLGGHISKKHLMKNNEDQKNMKTEQKVLDDIEKNHMMLHEIPYVKYEEDIYMDS